MPFPGTRSRHLAMPRCQTTDPTLHSLSDAYLADGIKLSAHNRMSSRFKSAQIGKSEGLKQAMASLRKANSGPIPGGAPTPPALR